MKTRSIFRRLRLPLLSAAALLGLAETANAQNPSMWIGAGGDGNWSNAANWDVVPVSNNDTDLIFINGANLNTFNDIANPFQLTTLTLDPGTSDTVISGGGLTFITGSTVPSGINFNTAGGRLVINTPVSFSVPSTINIGPGANNAGGAEIFLNGPIINSVGNVITLQTTPAATNVVINRANNTSFAGSWNATASTLTQLGTYNAMWRTTAITFVGTSAVTTGTTTAAGFGILDAGYNQQIGSAAGPGQFLVGTTDSASTALLGFLGGNQNLNGPAGFAGFNPDSHLGKVGTGVLTVSGENASLNMSFSVRDGGLLLNGGLGALVNSLPTAGQISVYTGGQIRLNNTTAPFAPPSLTPMNAQGRISDTRTIRLAGGVLRLDGPSVLSALGSLEQAGAIRPIAGLSVVVVNANAGQPVAFNFDSVNTDGLARGGQVAFVGTNLGLTPGAGVAGITFTTAPTVVNGVIPYGISQTGYTGSTTAASNTFAFNALAELGPNGVRPLTNFVDNDFSSATQNVRANAATPGVSGSANSLTFTGGTGVVTTSGPLAITSGAVFSNGSGTIDGTGSLTTTGRMYLSSGPLASDTLTVTVPVSGSGLSKGGAGVVNVGTLNLTGASPIIQANSGTLNVAGPVTVGSGNAVFQVSRNAFISLPATGVPGTLRGGGTVNGNVNMLTGSLIGASSLASDVGGPAGLTGASPGVMNITGNLAFTGGPNTRLRFYLSSVFGGQYTQGLITTSALDLTAVNAGAPLTIQPHSIDLKNNDTANVYDFNTAENYTWTLVDGTNPIINFNSNAFNIDLSNFTNSVSGTFTVGTADAGTNLVLTFTTSIPEPALMGVVALGLAGLVRLRRKA